MAKKPENKGINPFEGDFEFDDLDIDTDEVAKVVEEFSDYARLEKEYGSETVKSNSNLDENLKIEKENTITVDGDSESIDALRKEVEKLKEQTEEFKKIIEQQTEKLNEKKDVDKEPVQDLGEEEKMKLSNFFTSGLKSTLITGAIVGGLAALTILMPAVPIGLFLVATASITAYAAVNHIRKNPEMYAKATKIVFNNAKELGKAALSKAKGLFKGKEKDSKEVIVDLDESLDNDFEITKENFDKKGKEKESKEIVVDLDEPLEKNSIEQEKHSKEEIIDIGESLDNDFEITKENFDQKDESLDNKNIDITIEKLRNEPIPFSEKQKIKQLKQQLEQESVNDYNEGINTYDKEISKNLKKSKIVSKQKFEKQNEIKEVEKQLSKAEKNTENYDKLVEKKDKLTKEFKVKENVFEALKDERKELKAQKEEFKKEFKKESKKFQKAIIEGEKDINKISKQIDKSAKNLSQIANKSKGPDKGL